MANSHSVAITIADGVTHTYGKGGDTQNAVLPTYTDHKVEVLSGILAVTSTTEGTNTPVTRATGKTSAVQDIYELPSTKLFSFTATGTTEIVVTSW